MVVKFDFVGVRLQNSYQPGCDLIDISRALYLALAGMSAYKIGIFWFLYFFAFHLVLP